MSITLKAQVTFGLTIVVIAETLKFVSDARTECKAMTPEQVAEKLKDATGEERFKFELFRSDKTDEEVVEVIYRTAMRGFLRDELKSQLSNSESSARIGNIKVDFGAKELTAKQRKRLTADAALAHWLTGGSQMWTMHSSLKDFQAVAAGRNA